MERARGLVREPGTEGVGSGSDGRFGKRTKTDVLEVTEGEDVYVS